VVWCWTVRTIRGFMASPSSAKAQGVGRGGEEAGAPDQGHLRAGGGQCPFSCLFLWLNFLPSLRARITATSCNASSARVLPWSIVTCFTGVVLVNRRACPVSKRITCSASCVASSRMTTRFCKIPPQRLPPAQRPRLGHSHAQAPCQGGLLIYY
jgi:hypothetical protein